MHKSRFRNFVKQLLIVTNIVLAAFFLLGCYCSWFNPAHWWFLGFLTLLSFYFLLILFGFVLFWLFVKPRWCFISVLAIALTYKPIVNIVPLRFSSTFVTHKQTDALRIMSWNVAQFDILDYKKSPQVKNKMIDLINQYQPDIACFQEMVAADSNVDIKTAYYKRFSFYPLEQFKSDLHLPNHFYSYNSKWNFLTGQHFGIIIFSKYPIVNEQTIVGTAGDYNSTFQYVDVVKGNDTIRIFNLHLQSLKFNNVNLEYIDKPSISDEEDLKKSKNIINKFKIGFLRRKIQAERIHTEIKKSPYPAIVCGDFNDVPNSYAYATIGNGLKNAFVAKGSGIGRTFSGISPTLRIDNIFVSPAFDVQQFTRINKKLSDHFPIITDVQLEKK